MQTIKSINEMQSRAIGLRSRGELIALVPTMGCLHEGHLSLIDIAKERADKVVVSIFVNPAQFEPNEDFEHYPRTLEDDLEKCKERGVDILFNPSTEEIYPEGYSTYIDEEQVSSGLCGISRPRHFRGVTTVCLKLFNIVRPDMAILGQKDAQQCAVIQKMVMDLNIPTEILVGETKRNEDGLAISSRNRYLTNTQHEEALSISKALIMGKSMVQDDGVRSVDRVVAEIIHKLLASRRIRVIYVQIVDSLTMESAGRDIIPGKHIACIAVWIDQIRLIDNISL
ncbi:MAG: pantoate--beta-alanine ligase [Lentimonas sp.]|jgi:pantoate--beta-alanine ligase